jgi:hypothetical protein
MARLKMGVGVEVVVGVVCHQGQRLSEITARVAIG